MHSDYCNKKCCGTCEHYTGKRTVSMPFGDVNVDVEYEGLCSYQWGSPKVKENDYCYNYKKSKDIEVAQKKVELEEFKRKQEQQQRENEKKLREIQREKDRVTSSTTRSHTDILSATSNSSSNSSSKAGVLFGGLGIGVIIIVGIIIAICSLFIPKDYTSTLTGENKTIAEYIISNGTKDSSYSEYYLKKDIIVDGKNYDFEIRYFNKKTESGNFAVYITSQGGISDNYEYYEGCFYFDFGNKASFGVSGTASYDDGPVFIYYKGITYGECPEINYSSTQISNIYNINLSNDMKNQAIAGTWKCVEVCVSSANDFLKTINCSYSLW